VQGIKKLLIAGSKVHCIAVREFNQHRIEQRSIEQHLAEQPDENEGRT
jgi:hypothetical protein